MWAHFTVAPVRISTSSLWSEIQPLWLGVKEPPLVAVFAGYFDDSHRFNDENRGGVLAIAGYVAAVSVWDTLFHHEWWSTIAAAPHPLTEFKASDCRNCEGEFKNWTKEERDQLTKNLVSVIAAPHYHGLMFGLGSAIEVPFTEDTEHRKTFLALAYNLCLGRIVTGALRWARPRHSSIDALHFIFDEQPGLMGFATGLFREAREVYEEQFRARIRLPQFGESVHLAPLQAADLLAYETYKELYNRALPNPRT